MIRIGQVLKIPPRGQGSRPSLVYQVQPGETLSGIANKFGVSTRALQDLNDISKPQFLRAGVSLRIPANGKPQYAWHTIQAGQTMASIARKYGVSIDAIASANQLNDVDSIRIGQKLKVPGG